MIRVEIGVFKSCMSIFFGFKMPCSYRVITIIITIKVFHFKNYTLNWFSFDAEFLNIKRTSFIEFRNVFKGYFKSRFCVSWHCYSYRLSLIVILMIVWRCYFWNVICGSYFIYLPIPWTYYIAFLVCSWVYPCLSTVIRKRKCTCVSRLICC